MGAPEEVEVEAELRFPWKGGRHPWLDAALVTPNTLVGVESKRYEPFRPGKATVFSEAYDSRDWGPGMAGYDALRAALTEGRLTKIKRHKPLPNHCIGGGARRAGALFSPAAPVTGHNP